MEPRLMRINDAYRHMGLCRDYFNRWIRPGLPEIRQGKAVLFDCKDIITIHYSPAEIGRLVIEAEKIVDSSPLLLARHADWAGQNRAKHCSQTEAVTLQ
ncbi:hypothetical protein GWP57_01905 [Gammaproteobacteria bacterium]|jgi:hypothetical protein|nr:hypothetical protein [Gammaproteobacteria bacterium]